KLTAQTVTPELTSTDAALKETASWVAGRHPEWGDGLAGFFRDRLAAKELTATERDELTGQLARFTRTPAVQLLLADQLTVGATRNDDAILALRAMARSGLKEAPTTWVAGLAWLLTNGDGDLKREA